MSNSINPLQIVKVSDPRTESSMQQTYAVIEASENVVHKEFPYSTLSSAQISFNGVNPPSSRIYVSKKFTMGLQFQITITGTCAPGANILDSLGQDMAMRCFPVNRSLSSTTLSLNNSNFSTDQHDLVKILERYNFKKCSKSIASPTYPDVSQLYSECANFPNNNNRNPLGSNLESVSHRGDIHYDIIHNSPTSGTFRVRCYEPLCVSPLVYDCAQDASTYFIHLRSVAFNASFRSDLSKSVFSISDNSSVNLTSINTSVIDGSLSFVYVTPNLLDPQPLPMVSYPFYNINRQIQNSSSVAGGILYTQSTNSLQLSSVPKLIYLLVAPNDNDKNVFSTDTYCSIENISIDLMNRNSLLSTASKEELHSIAVSNGCDINYLDFVGRSKKVGDPTRFISGCGAVMCIDVSKDLGLSLGSVQGSSQSTQLQIKVSYRSLFPEGSAPRNFSVYIYTVTDGIMTLSMNDSALIQESIVTTSDIINTSDIKEQYSASDILANNSNTGGNVFGDASRWIRTKAIPWIKAHEGDIKQGAMIVKSLLGAGMEGGCDYGSGLIGGRAVSRKTLKNLLR